MNLPKDVVELASLIQAAQLFPTPGSSNSSLQFFVINTNSSDKGDSDGDVKLPKFPLYYVRSVQLDTHGYPNVYVKLMDYYLEEVVKGCWAADTGDDILYKGPEQQVAWLLLGK